MVDDVLYAVAALILLMMESVVEDEDNKIDRKNTEEYARAMQLNPFADADDSMFINEVRNLRCSSTSHMYVRADDDIVYCSLV